MRASMPESSHIRVQFLTIGNIKICSGSLIQGVFPHINRYCGDAVRQLVHITVNPVSVSKILLSIWQIIWRLLKIKPCFFRYNLWPNRWHLIYNFSLLSLQTVNILVTCWEILMTNVPTWNVTMETSLVLINMDACSSLSELDVVHQVIHDEIPTKTSASTWLLWWKQIFHFYIQKIGTCYIWPPICQIRPYWFCVAAYRLSPYSVRSLS